MNYQISSKIKNLGMILAIAMFAVSGVFAQSNSGSITGVVQDQSGAVVPNATVTITNVGTNEERTVQADGNGLYIVPSLSTGIYKVTAAASNFQPITVTDVNLAVGEKRRVDLNLSVGDVSATVTVSANQTVVDTEKSAIGDTITAERIADSPVNGRDFISLLANVPGSVQSTNQFQTSINGIPSTFGGSNVLVDGIDAGRVDLNGTSNVLGRVESRVNRVSLDSIQEVQVVEQNYAAEYGQAVGSIINPITKSGGNEFHGGLFEYYRNEAFDANDFFNNAQGFNRSKFRLHQFGGNISGPIVKDKLFFFTNYEGVQQDRGILLQGLVPTAEFRNEFVPALAPVLSVLPLPNQPLRQNADADPLLELGLFSTQKVSELTENTGSVKLDYNYSDKSQFSLRYNINDSNTITPYGVGLDQFADGDLRVQLFKLSNTYTLSPNAVNEFAFGINRNVTTSGAGPSTLPRFNFIFVDQAIASPGPAQFDQFRASTVFHFTDSLTYIYNNHAFKMGGDMRINRRAARSEQQDSLIFFGVNDFANNAPFIAQRDGNPTLGYGNENFSLFFQDDWKVNPRLTLNLGLRYEVSTVSREKYGRLQNFNVDTLTFSPIGEKIHDADTNNFAPRIGFAFDVFGNQETVLRGGYGIFYNIEYPASFGSPQVNSFPSLSVNVFQTPITFPINDNIFNAATLASRNVFTIDRDLPTTMAQQYSLNVQHDFGFGVAQVGYVGNKVSNILTNGVITPVNINPQLDVFGTRPIAGIADVRRVGTYPESNYNSLQTSIKRNFSQGFRYNVNYTWSHTIDTAIGFFKEYQNYQDFEAERASSDQDIRHNLTFDFGYDIPSFRRVFGEGLPRWIADGWQLNSLTQIRSGFPVNVLVTGGIFGGGLRPDAVPGVSPYPTNYSVPNNQFNPDAFALPAGQFGTLGRNTLRGPGFGQVDFSVFKNTRINEKQSLQLRMEVFNIFNRTNFADPFNGLNADLINNTLTPNTFFGQSTSTVGNQLGGLLGAGGPRQIQFAIRYSF